MGDSCSRLVQCGFIRGCGHRAAKRVRGGQYLPTVGPRDRTNGERLNLKGGKTDRVDEEARKGGWVEDATEGRSDVNVLAASEGETRNKRKFYW